MSNTLFDEDYFVAQQKFTNRSPLLIVIKIYEKPLIKDTNCEDWVLIREHKRDIRKGKNKDWIVNAIMWAICNQKRVEIERK